MKIKNQNRIKKKKSPPKSLSQQKFKSKSKPKNLPFNPLQYLNALIELTNDTNAIKVKKNKIPQKRDLSSALTIATPAMQKTISTSKIRCKSSYSQYRKKSVTSNVNNIKNVKDLKEVLDVNLKNYIITEEEENSNCIKFTSMQSVKNSRQQTPMGKKEQGQAIYLKKMEPKLKFLNRKMELIDLPEKIDYNYYARKIQRAWRSFQTYKVIHKYYRHFKKERRQEKQQAEDERKLQYASRGSKRDESQYDHDQQQHQEEPSVYAYLNNYNDIPLNSNDLITAHDELLARTIKFKIRNAQQSVDNPHHSSNELKNRDQNESFLLKQQHSESQNSLNLTQKLNQIKNYIHQGSKNQPNLPEMSQTPTVEIKKSIRPQSHILLQQLNSLNSVPKKQTREPNSEDNQSTEKKRNLLSSIKISKNPQQNFSSSDLRQFTLNQSLDRSPTLKEDFNSSLKKQILKISEPPTLKHPSLVDSMIKKETEKYNEILSLIELCKTDRNRNNTNAPNILSEVMKKLEQHKSELEKMEGIKQENVLSVNFKGMSENSVKEGSSCGNNSFLAFESKDIYHSFEDYDFNSEEKMKVNRQNEAENRRSKQKGLQKQQSRKSEHLTNDRAKQEKTIKVGTKQQICKEKSEILQRFSSLLDKQEQKLTELIKSSKKQQQIVIQDIHSDESAQSSQFYLSDQFENHINQIKSFEQQNSNQQKHEQLSKDEESYSMYSFCSSECESDAANKMFHQHLNIITLNKQKCIQNLNKLVEQNKIPQESFSARLKQIQEKFSLQKISIETKKQQYIKSLNSVKNQALQFQKDLLASSKKVQTFNELDVEDLIQINKKYSNLAVRKSFSAESIVLKCILKQPVLTTKNIVQDRFLIKQKGIHANESSNESDYGDGQNLNEEKSIQEVLRPQSEVKIDHKQNIIWKKEELNPFENEFSNTFENGLLNQSQLFQIKESNGSGVLHLRIDDNQSKELKKQQKKERMIQRDMVSKKTNEYFQCEQVWMRVNDVQHQRSAENQHIQASISQKDRFSRLANYADNEEQQNLAYLEETKSEDSDELLIGQAPKQQSQTSSLLKSSSIHSNDTPILYSSCVLMQRCSQQLEQLIQTELIDELLQIIYLNDSMLLQFKPFIEEIFEFLPITDFSILNFIQKDLPKYFPPFQELIQRANQKINPTSQEILRLVRDFDYEIDEYQLILSEDIFKNVRKSIELEYQQKVTLKNQLPINPSNHLKNQQILQKMKKRELEKRAKVQKYLGYERDMKIMYMKAVFNCMNEFLIEQKSIATHVNARSTIGTGELSLSIKEFNIHCKKEDVENFFTKTKQRIKNLLNNKCMLPNFKNYKDVGLFQKQMLKMIKTELDENEYKWVTYMDEVLEIWNEIANQICDEMELEAIQEMLLAKEKQIDL